ncbi:aldo/keto reductase [Oricola cellulosilytica]|uniref:Aldo/keto reductase n=1 Tax=Oricola cellulosilytica TaxID=1429082 RepID=A0A4R0PGB9_9HYPH|nr:aldo/keto reductase [Oricola cellulosilytica]TCD16128.1 aldo/keto reductase [Oricola cellulosilytica]
MKYRKLGRTGLDVSAICLGTMTWGTQNTEAEGHQQMDYAVGKGVNFFDTAELYPTTPLSAETYGRTEEIIGTWFAKSGKRDDIVLATKVAGPGRDYIDDGAPLSAEKIRRACDRSLKRLQTDYIDLYQMHWPNRGSYHFRQTWTWKPHKEDSARARDDIREILETLDALVKEGKVRHAGLSNETVWGTMRYLELGERHGWPRIQTMQNEYSLLHRIYDTDFAEFSHHEDVGLICYSPLAAGILSGKFRDGTVPPGTRLSMQPDLNGRYTERSKPALEEYLQVADRHGLDPAQMALAFCLSRPFMTAVIIGATSMDQLKADIGAIDVDLSDEILADIHAVYRKYPIPM